MTLRAVDGPSDLSYQELIASFVYHLECGIGGSRGVASPKTVRIYTEAAREFAAWAATHGRSLVPSRTTQDDVAAYFRWCAEEKGLAPATVNQRFRSLQQFFAYLLRQGEFALHPMTGLHQPKIPDRPPPIIPDAHVAALLKTCKGKYFTDRRDLAILRLFESVGPRVGEVVGIRYTPANPDTNDVDLKGRQVRVTGKNRKTRWVPLSASTVAAFDQYLRVRSRHPDAALPSLFLGERGRLTDSGVRQMIERRSRTAGLPGRAPHPHLFRHRAAHKMLEQGLGERDVMYIMGWDSPAMLARYGRSAAAERARKHFWDHF